MLIWEQLDHRSRRIKSSCSDIKIKGVQPAPTQALFDISWNWLEAQNVRDTMFINHNAVYSAGASQPFLLPFVCWVSLDGQLPRAGTAHASVFALRQAQGGLVLSGSWGNNNDDDGGCAESSPPLPPCLENQLLPMIMCRNWLLLDA